MATAIQSFLSGRLPPRTITSAAPSPSTPGGQQRVSLSATNPLAATGWYHPPGGVIGTPAPTPTQVQVTPNQPSSPSGGSGPVSTVLPVTLPGDNQAPATGNTTTSPLPINPVTTPNEQVGLPTSPQAGLSFAQVENYWIQAGGSPQAASMAAAVADAESGLNAAAQRTNPDGSTGVGLWLIPSNGTPPGSTDPLANARAAVQLSQNGTDWTQWCSTWSDNNCGENNGTYLGTGANALMSLAGQKPGASYNVFGATPSSSGVGASTATSGMPGTTSGASGKSSLLPFIVIIVITGAIIYFANRKSQAEATSGE